MNAAPVRIAYNRKNPTTGAVNTMQAEAFADVETFLLFVEGGVGSGKTHELCMKVIKLSKLNAGVDGGILVPDYAMFKRDVLTCMSNIATRSGFDHGYNGHGHYFVFPWAKGSKMVWVFSADTSFPGANLGWGVINEYSIIPLDKIEEFVERRVRLKCPYPQIEAVGTPEDKFGWLEEFIEKWSKKVNKAGKALVRFVNGSSDMNAHNLRDGYVDQMRDSLDPVSFDLWFKGLRVRSKTNLFYYTFGPANFKKLERREGRLVHVGLDFNVGNMHAVMAHFLGEGEKKTAEVFDEIVLKNVAADTYEMGEAIKKWNGGHMRDILITCDASGQARKTTGASDVQALESMEASRVRLRNVNPLMRERQLRAAGLFSHKRLLIDSAKCPILRRDLERVTQEKISLKKFKDPKGIFTHASDALDYLLDFEFPELPGNLRGRDKRSELEGLTMAKYKMPDGSEAVGPIQDAVYYDVELRKKTINNLLTRENFSRKDEARKRYEVYNDGIRKWVEKTLRAETRANTVDEMMRRATSFNFCKKIINKLARVYKAKVTRKVLPPADVTKQTRWSLCWPARFKAATDSFSQFVSGKPPDPKKKPTGPPEPPTDSPAVATSKQQTNQVQLLSRLLETDTTMKRVDQFVNLFRNILVYIRPVEDRYEEGKYKLKMEVLNPAQYDVLENEQDPTQADVIIIAQGYANSIQLQLTQDPSAFQGSRQPSEDVFSGQRPDPLHPGESSGNTTGVGNIVTELSFSDEAKKQMRFIWWSDKYHYVTDGNGEFIDDNGDFESNPDHLNPLGEMPIISLNKNQTERYWAPGWRTRFGGRHDYHQCFDD